GTSSPVASTSGSRGSVASGVGPAVGGDVGSAVVGGALVVGTDVGSGVVGPGSSVPHAARAMTASTAATSRRVIRSGYGSVPARRGARLPVDAVRAAGVTVVHPG